MTVGIYAIYDVRDNTCLYVGQSQNIESRQKQHLKRLRTNTALAEFVVWFDQNNRDESILTFTLVEEVENTDAAKNEAEMRWFRELKPLFYGKEPNANERWSHSDATRQKIAATLRANNAGNTLADIVHTCPQCMRTFSSGRRDTKFCSKQCADKAQVRVEPKEVWGLHKEKLSLREIAKIVGVSHITVRKIIQHQVKLQG